MLAPAGAELRGLRGPARRARAGTGGARAVRGRAAAVEVMALPPGPADETRRDRGRAARATAARVGRQRLPVWDKERAVLRPVTFGDMAILFRATTSLPIYEEVFKAAGLPYVTVSGRGYYDRPEVRDLTALLACLHNPADDLSLATVLRSPMFSLSDEIAVPAALVWCGRRAGRATRFPSPQRSTRRRAVHGHAPQATEIAFAAETMAGLRAATGRIDVWTLLRQALDRTGYEATLALADEEARSKWGRRARPRQRRQVSAAGAGSRRRRPVAHSCSRCKTCARGKRARARRCPTSRRRARSS